MTPLPRHAWNYLCLLFDWHSNLHRLRAGAPSLTHCSVHRSDTSQPLASSQTQSHHVFSRPVTPSRALPPARFQHELAAFSAFDTAVHSRGRKHSGELVQFPSGGHSAQIKPQNHKIAAFPVAIETTVSHLQYNAFASLCAELFPSATE